MKKLKSLLLVAVTLLAFSACNNEIDPVIDNTGDDITGYLTLNISSPEIRSTRTAPGDKGTEDGVGAENTISTVTVVLTDATGTITTVVEATSSDSFAGGKTDKFLVPTGTHYVYALVNKPSEVILTKGANIQRVITVAQAADATKGFKDGKFFMVNEKHTSSADAGVSTTITSANVEGSPAKASIKVDRVAVKIVPKTSTPTVNITTNPATITGVELVGYLPLNVNKQFNLVQKWGATNTGGVTVTEALETPLYPGGSTALVKDQYFHNISEYTTITKDVSKVITSIVINPTIPATTNLDIPVYATENRPTILSYNTPAKPTAGQGETTGIIYKVQAKGASGNLGTFYEYRGMIYTVKADLEAAYIADFSSVTSVEFNGYSVGELRAKGIKVFENGIMYYTYFIKGNNSNNNHKWGTPAENYYGVFRNSVYNLTVNTITNIGDDVPGGGKVDPEEPLEPGNPPIDTDEAYIEVTVTVNPWVLNDLGIDL